MSQNKLQADNKSYNQFPDKSGFQISDFEVDSSKVFKKGRTVNNMQQLNNSNQRVKMIFKQQENKETRSQIPQNDQNQRRNSYSRSGSKDSSLVLKRKNQSDYFRLEDIEEYDNRIQ